MTKSDVNTSSEAVQRKLKKTQNCVDGRLNRHGTAGASSKVVEGKVTEGAVVLMFTGVRYERQKPPMPVKLQKIIANNNISLK